jgi:hypothetical protein
VIAVKIDFQISHSFFYFSRNPELSTSVGSECGSIEVNNMSDVKNEDVEPNIFDEL